MENVSQPDGSDFVAGKAGEASDAEAETADPNSSKNWWEDGACKGLEAEIFYPDSEAEAVMAKSICEGCCVQGACLEHALAVREKAGVWGGATERDRRRILRQRRSKR